METIPAVPVIRVKFCSVCFALLHLGNTTIGRKWCDGCRVDNARWRWHRQRAAKGLRATTYITRRNLEEAASLKGVIQAGPLVVMCPECVAPVVEADVGGIQSCSCGWAQKVMPGEMARFLAAISARAEEAFAGLLGWDEAMSIIRSVSKTVPMDIRSERRREIITRVPKPRAAATGNVGTCREKPAPAPANVDKKMTAARVPLLRVESPTETEVFLVARNLVSCGPYNLRLRLDACIAYWTDANVNGGRSRFYDRSDCVNCVQGRERAKKQ